MKLRIAFALLFFSCSAFGKIRVCPGTVDHIIIDQGISISLPSAIIPDVAAGDKNRRQKWNYLNNAPDLPLLVVHCYYSADEKQAKDVAIPSDIHKCSFFKGAFYCRK